MASASCSECSRAFSTSLDSYPFCSFDCKAEDARRKERRAARGSASPSPGRVRGF